MARFLAFARCDASPDTATQDQSGPAVGCEIFLPCFVTAVLTFFIAGLLFICASEHVDNLGAYTASRPETGLLFPSDYDS